MSQNKQAARDYPVIQLVHAQSGAAEKIDDRWTQLDLGRMGLQAFIGGRAFRSYDVLSNTVGLNQAGDLRGMVVSAKWATLFRYTSDARWKVGVCSRA